MLLAKEREAVAEYGRKLITHGLVKGTGGNVSLSDPEKKYLAISPSGQPYFDIYPKDVIVVDFEGNQLEGTTSPSSELNFHLGLQKLRPEIRAVVHTHSVYAATIACLGWEIPPIHYLVGVAGTSIPCAPYATYGSQELADHICATIGERNAVLMANHGAVAVGDTLHRAFSRAETVEFLAQIYLQAKSIGTPNLLTDDQMEEVLRKFKSSRAPKTEPDSIQPTED
jgi:L-fuculose-phosphate aldolase